MVSGLPWPTGQPELRGLCIDQEEPVASTTQVFKENVSNANGRFPIIGVLYSSMYNHESKL